MRAETGTIKFEDDWTGVFIRGDNALDYLFSLEQLLDLYKEGPGEKDVLGIISPIESLLRLLNYSNENLRDKECQMMKKFEDCRKNK